MSVLYQLTVGVTQMRKKIAMPTRVIDDCILSLLLYLAFEAALKKYWYKKQTKQHSNRQCLLVLPGVIRYLALSLFKMQKQISSK